MLHWKAAWFLSGFIQLEAAIATEVRRCSLGPGHVTQNLCESASMRVLNCRPRPPLKVDECTGTSAS
jgi:hypothetical protein